MEEKEGGNLREKNSEMTGNRARKIGKDRGDESQWEKIDTSNILHRHAVASE